MINKKYSIIVLFLLSISCAKNIPLDTTGWPVPFDNKSDSNSKKLTNRDLTSKSPTNIIYDSNQKSSPPSSSSSSSSNNNSNTNTVYSPVTSSSTTPTDTTGGSSDISTKTVITGKILDYQGNIFLNAIIQAESIDPAVTWKSEIQQTIDGMYVFNNVPTGIRIKITAQVNQNIPVSQTIVAKSNLTGNPTANQYNFEGIYAIDYRPLEGKIYDENNKLITSEVEVIGESNEYNKPWNEKAEFINGTYKFKNIPLEVNMIKITVKAKGKEKVRFYDLNKQGPFFLNFGGSNDNDKAFAIKNSSNKSLAWDINRFIETNSNPFSTFAVDVDTASYTLMRNSVMNAGSLPSQESVRIEEYVNYFDYNYPKPEKSFSINTEITNSPFNENKKQNMKLLRIGLQTPSFKVENRKNISVTFVIDVSGSMLENNKIDTIKNSLKIFLKQLTPKDRISIVSYNHVSNVVIDNADIYQENKIIEAINSLRADNKTNIEEGLKTGSITAQKNFISGYENRIILCSDGINNMGELDAKRILDKIKKQSEISGISVSSVGVGFSNYNDSFLEKIAVNGDGYYAYIDNEKEAVRVFVEQITNNFQIVAKDAKIQVKFHPKAVKYYRLLGYENKILSYSDFRDNSIQAGEIGPNHSVTALYEIEMNDTIDKNDDLVSTTLRYKDVNNNESVLEINNNIKVNQIKEYKNSSYSFKLASVVALYAEILRGSYWYLSNDLDAVIKNLNEIIKESKNDEKVSEFKKIVEKASSIKR
jgi:Ca-activated chloride channel family protein